MSKISNSPNRLHRQKSGRRHTLGAFQGACHRVETFDLTAEQLPWGFILAAQDALEASGSKRGENLRPFFFTNLSQGGPFENLGNDGIEEHVEPCLAGMRVDPPEGIQKIPSFQATPVLLCIGKALGNRIHSEKQVPVVQTSHAILAKHEKIAVEESWDLGFRHRLHQPFDRVQRLPGPGRW